MKNIYDHLLNSPHFADEVYQNLPPLLKTATDLFSNNRDKDIILTSSITTLSGCFASIKGQYHDNWVHPNLFSFVVAPPASNKGIMNFSQILGSLIHKEFLSTHPERAAEYVIKLKEYNRLSKKDPNLLAPIRPKLPVLFVPGNISSAKLYQMLSDSGGCGIMFETEADTLAGAIQQDWGNFSDLFRKSFHHESLSLSRANKDTYIYIEKPTLSILLSGTPSQVSKLISSTQDGLMSRFIYYVYAAHVMWKSAKPIPNRTDPKKVFEELAKEVYEIKKTLDSHNYVFLLKDHQYDMMDDFFNKNLKDLTALEGHNAASPVIRMGLITYRIAMILTVLRNQERLIQDTNLSCGDEDFHVSLKIVDVLLKHSMLMYGMLPKEQSNLNTTATKFYQELPVGKVFTREEANIVGKELGISERTVGNYITDFKDRELILDEGFGKFSKPKSTV